MLKRKIPEKASMAFEKDLNLIFPEQEPKIETRFHNRISVCEPTIGHLEREYIKRVMDSGWISSLGPEVKKFERGFAIKVGAKHAVSCTSGTAALHLALAALGIGPGDEVIIPTFTMIATISTILYLGATPILVDADERMNMDIQQVRDKITSKTKCIIPVHIYGYPCRMNELMSLGNYFGIWIVEDAAESHGAEYRGKQVGTIGDIGIFSFYANKMITTGEGGILTTNEKEIAERIRTLMNHAFSPERHFCHRLLGYNYRMTALQAALGRAQLRNWDKLISARNLLRITYIKRIHDQGISAEIPNKIPEDGINPVCWMFGVLTDRKRKNYIRRELAKRGVETRNFFVPMHLQPTHYERFKGQRYPVAESLMERGFYLPSASHLTESEIDYICQQLKELI